MLTILLNSQYYNTPGPTGFGPYWPIIRQHTIVQNSCFIQSFFDILKLVNLFCWLGINEFHILQNMIYNSIITIQTN